MHRGSPAILRQKVKDVRCKIQDSSYFQDLCSYCLVRTTSSFHCYAVKRVRPGKRWNGGGDTMLLIGGMQVLIGDGARFCEEVKKATRALFEAKARSSGVSEC